jgi:hypothetical protein
MREFESSHSSHAFAFSENFLSLMRKARQMRAFLIASKPEAGIPFGRGALQRPEVAGSMPALIKEGSLRPSDPGTGRSTVRPSDFS